ncbi:LPS translocon maturation chaperone LptM [Pseudomonas aeruginosa]
MKNVFKALTVLLTLFSLTGCGLKGPLYFPPADKNNEQDNKQTTLR